MGESATDKWSVGQADKEEKTATDTKIIKDFSIERTKKKLKNQIYLVSIYIL